MACAKLAPLFEFGWAGLAGSLWLGLAWARLTSNDPTPQTLPAENMCRKNPIRLASCSNASQAVSRSYATTSLAAHDLGYGKQFQGSRMSENLGTPRNPLQAICVRIMPFNGPPAML
ncbi:hypothetical protein B0H14DRAFT_2640274 [Mycena olivaceomarginata]|nr:hypothetical protein B0H14DRAFT_2640274 [Mycena olivaceomarginata]